MAAVRQRFGDDRQVAYLALAPRRRALGTVIIGFAARAVGVDRNVDIVERPAFDRLAVQDHRAATHRQRIAGQADDALDVIVLRARRRDDDDIAARRQAAEQAALDERQADAPAFLRPAQHQPLEDRDRVGDRRRDERPAIGEFRHHQPIADAQPRQHRFARDIERLGDEAVETEHDQDEPEDALHLTPPVGRLLGRRLGRRRRYRPVLSGLVTVQHRFLHALGSGIASMITKACAQG